VGDLVDIYDVKRQRSNAYLWPISGDDLGESDSGMGFPLAFTLRQPTRLESKIEVWRLLKTGEIFSKRERCGCATVS
jgi:hypothetical protein